MNLNRGYRKSTIPDNAQRVFEGVIFDIYQWEQKLFDGSTATFEKLTRPDTVVIFPVLSDGTVMLIDDEQPGRARELTAPAGRVEEGENPEGAARRELLEETGLKPASLTLLYTYTPAEKIDHVVHVFVGKGCTKVAEPHLDAGERIAPHLVTFDELIELGISGRYSYNRFPEMMLRAKADPTRMAELQKTFLG